MMKTMKLSDLKTGMWVKTRNGIRYLVSFWKREEIKISLSEFELIFLKSLNPEYKWIARDKNGSISLYMSKPKRNEDRGFWFNDSGNYLLNFIDYHVFKEEPFLLLSRENEEPLYVPDLLKGE